MPSAELAGGLTRVTLPNLIEKRVRLAKARAVLADARHIAWHHHIVIADALDDLEGLLANA